jgi:hypothetical protein
MRIRERPVGGNTLKFAAEPHAGSPFDGLARGAHEHCRHDE